MMRLIKRKDVESLWTENGDLERLQVFFQAVDSIAAENEGIKFRVKERALAKINSETAESDPGQPLFYGLRGLWEKINWKIGLPAAALGMAALLLVWFVAPGSPNPALPGMNVTYNDNPAAGNQPELPIREDVSASQGNELGDQDGKTPEIIYNDPATEVYGNQAAPEYDPGPIVGLGQQAEGEAEQPIDGKEPLSPDSVAVVPPYMAGIPDRTGKPDTEDAAASGANGLTDTDITDMGIIEGEPDELSGAGEFPLVTGITQFTNNMLITLEVDSASDALARFSGDVQQLNGFVVGAQQVNAANPSTAYLKVEVPASNIDQLTALLSVEGKIVSQQLSDIDDPDLDTQADYAVIQIKFVSK